MTEPSLFENDASYRAVDRESFSSLKYILESPKVFKHYKAQPFKGSAATLLGTCIHHYLQGNRHLVAFNELPRTKKNAEVITEFERSFRESTNGEGVIVPKSFEAKLSLISKNFNENPKAIKILEPCKYELAYLFDFNNVPLKCKIDGVCIDKNYIVEIKSSSQASTADEFRQQALDMDYDMQAYLYTVASGLKDHYFVIVKSTDPHTISVFKSSTKFLESGRKKALEATELYKKYIINNEEWNESERYEEI